MVHGFSRRRLEEETPLRPRQHELEDASRRAFTSLIPDRLVFRALDHDYGIDGEVEEFAEGRATGVRFFVQLKATDEKKLDKALKTRVKLSTAAYFRAQSVPVLMVRYVAATNTLYARWFHQFDPYYEHLGEQELTFKWDPSEPLSEDGASRLFDEAAAVMDAKSLKLELPVRTGVSTPAGGAFGYSTSELKLGVRAAAKRCPDLLQIVGEDEEHLVALAIAEDQLSAHVPGLGSVTMHLEGAFNFDGGIDEIGIELLSCAVVALARAGHVDLASRVASFFFGQSLAARMPPLSFEVAEAMAYAARSSEALEIAEELDADGDDSARVAGFSFLLAALRRGVQLRGDEKSRLVETMEARIQRRQNEGNSVGAAGEAVGLGNFFRSVGDFPDAVHAYKNALSLDPSYESREHLWLELAGSYFLAGQYPESAEAYGRALSLSEETALEVQARQADALLHAGKYEVANRIFEPIVADETHVGAWAATKACALNWVISTTGITEQDRDVEAATSIAGNFAERTLSDVEVAEVSRTIWDLDAVSPLGWFNLARDYLDNGDEQSALYSYLVTAVIQEGDIEAWVNVVSLSLSLGEEALAAAAIVTGGRLNGERFLLELARVARENFPDEKTREEFLSAVSGMLDEALPAQSDPGFEIRFVSGDSPVESVHLPPPGRRT